MREVLVVCEGQTEREFCRTILAPYIGEKVALKATLVGQPNKKQGGIRPWKIYRRELLRLAKERQDRHVGVLVDYYAMPLCWPGRTNAPSKPVLERGKHIEEEVRRDLAPDIGDRIIPCIQLHEFESLIFVDPAQSAKGLSALANVSEPRIVAQMNTILTENKSEPEHINDSPQTAPSKRLEQLVKGYDKVAHGISAIQNVSLASLRKGCTWLDRWLSSLEALA